MSIGTGAAVDDARREPLLDVADIQGHLMPGYKTSNLALIGFGLDGPDRAWIGRLADRVASAADILSARARRRARLGDMNTPLVNVAFSHRAVVELTGDDDGFEDLAFRVGMKKRSLSLGDPRDPADPGNAARWEAGNAERPLDMVVIIGSDAQPALEEAVDGFVADAAQHGWAHTYTKFGSVLSGEREHFGFRDGVSQPGVRGLITDSPRTFLTPREIDPADPRAKRFARPGQHLVWPGEFILGYGAQVGDDPRTVTGPPPSIG